VDEADGQAPVLSADCALHEGARLIDLRENSACFHKQEGADPSQRNVPVIAIEKTHAKIFLKRAQLHAQGRLRQAETPRGAPEVKLFRRRYEISQFAKVHRFIRFSYHYAQKDILDSGSGNHQFSAHDGRRAHGGY
jgi:hypothetical protein